MFGGLANHLDRSVFPFSGPLDQALGKDASAHLASLFSEQNPKFACASVSRCGAHNSWPDVSSFKTNSGLCKMSFFFFFFFSAGEGGGGESWQVNVLRIPLGEEASSLIQTLGETLARSSKLLLNPLLCVEF